LWHQLTLQLVQFIKLPQVKDNVNLVHFYENFIKAFELKLNQLTFVRLVVDIGNSIQDVKQRIQFIKAVSELPKVVENNEASVNARAVLAELHIASGEPDSLAEAKVILEQAKTTLDETSGADAGVYSAYHRAWAAYHKLRGDFESFYSSALQYLGYTQLTSMEHSESLGLARDLVVAALLGEKLFSLGELMEHEILQKLGQSSEAWLVDILVAFNFGNLNAWKNLQQKYADEIVHSDLKGKESSLTAKIKILSLIELVFSKPSGQRRITFGTISQTSDVPLDQVELLVMRALSLGLLKGTIDEVDQVVNFTWVQPRILNLNQIAGMRTRLQTWVESVKGSLNLMENEMTPELIS